MGTCALVTCTALFFVCRRCDRGQRYCGAVCARAGKRRHARARGRRYEKTFEGRRRAAARAARYRAKKVTHTTPLPAGASGTVSQPATETTLTVARVGEELADVDTRDGSDAGTAGDPGAGPGGAAADGAARDAAVGADGSARAREAERGAGAVVRHEDVRCAVCGRRGDLVRRESLARSGGSRWRPALRAQGGGGPRH